MTRHPCATGCAMSILVLLSFFSLNVPSAHARPANSKQVQAFLPSDGLSGDYVRSIVRTDDGAIWFVCWGTGISRFDGYTWKHFGRTDGLPTSDVRMLFLDRDKRLWCATTEGVAYLDGERWRALEVNLPGIVRPSLFRICQRQNGALWFSIDDNRVVQFMPRPPDLQSPTSASHELQGEWALVLDSSGPGNKWVNALLSTQEDEVWMAISAVGVRAYRNNQWVTVGDGIEEKSFEFNSLVQTRDGTVWCANEHFLIQYANGVRTVLPYPNEVVACLEAAPNGGLYIGTDKRMQFYDGQNFKDIELGELVSPSLVRKIACVEPDILWIGTRYGAYRVSDNVWAKSNPEFPSAALQAATIHADRQHQLMTHDRKGNIYQWNGKSWSLLISIESPQTLCLDMTRECNGKVWVLYINTVVEVSTPEKKILRTITLPKIEGTPSIYCSPSGRLFIHCRSEIYEYVDKAWRSFRTNPTNEVRSIFEDSTGAVWVCWTNRLDRCTADTWQDMTQGPDSSLYQSLETITETKDHKILVGIAGKGIYTLQNDRLVLQIPPEGAPSTQSSALFESSDGTIWVGNRQTGISSYRNGLWIAFKQEQGVPEGRVHTIVEDPQGIIWALIDENGIFRFNPQPDPPKTTIAHSPTTTAYADRAVFQCTAVDKWKVTRAQDLKFSWRILLPEETEVIQDWTPFTADTFIIAPRLSPGRYILEARTQDLDRNVDPAPARASFIIQRPFWLLPLFYVPLGGLGLAVVVLAIAWIRKQRLLAESERKHREILNAITEIVYALTPEGVIAYVSPSIEVILGYKPREVIGVSILEFMPEADAQRLNEQIEVLPLSKNIKAEYPFITASKETRWLRLSFQSIIEKDLMIDIKGIATDITERRLAEDALKATLDDLEHLVEERTREVIQVNKSLTAEIEERKRFEEEQHRLEEQLAQAHRMESIGRLAGGIAHDFNNVLAVILGHGDLMIADLNEDSEMRESLNEIIAAGERAKDLTRQLLAFSRKQVLEVRSIDPNAILISMEKMLRRLLGEDIVISVKTGKNVGLIHADPSQLEQVLLNLCVNARDAMPNGGTLTIETEQVFLDEKQANIQANVAPGSYVILTVTDTGFGMDEDTRQHIFEPFFTTKEKGKGTGLGLSTVYGIVQQHGGSIWVFSEPGHGATFKVYLPQSRGVKTKDWKETVESTIRGKGETILVVEDDEGVRRLTCQMLTRLGYSVLEAEDAGTCFNLAAQTPQLDLLLTDVIMPGMNGRQVAEHLTTLRPGIKVVFMSGYTEDIIGHHGILDEGTHFIPKPFSEAALSAKIYEALHQ